MNNFMLVLRHELSTTIRRRSFQYSALGIPLIAFIVFGLTSLWSSYTVRSQESLSSVNSSLENEKKNGRQVGYIDHSGLIQFIPESVTGDSLTPFPNESAAKQALREDSIEAYYIIPEDYIKTGEIFYVQTEFNPFAKQFSINELQRLLQVNLLGGNMHLANQYNNPFDLQIELLGETDQENDGGPLAFFLPFAITLFFYITILMTASLLLSSITRDKVNRMLEILMVSLTPREMLSGKIVGLGVAGLIQVFCWVGTAYFLFILSDRDLRIPFEYQLPESFILWAIIYFILGYLLYASLMASIGALVTNLREASQLSFVLLLPMMVPLITITVFMRYPNGLLATFLSLFPLTSPVTMLARIAISNIPIWQLVISISLLVLTSFLILRWVSGLFRMQMILVGQPFSIQRMIQTLNK